MANFEAFCWNFSSTTNSEIFFIAASFKNLKKNIDFTLCDKHHGASLNCNMFQILEEKKANCNLTWIQNPCSKLHPSLHLGQSQFGPSHPSSHLQVRG